MFVLFPGFRAKSFVRMTDRFRYLHICRFEDTTKQQSTTEKKNGRHHHHHYEKQLAMKHFNLSTARYRMRSRLNWRSNEWVRTRCQHRSRRAAPHELRVVQLIQCWYLFFLLCWRRSQCINLEITSFWIRQQQSKRTKKKRKVKNIRPHKDTSLRESEVNLISFQCFFPARLLAEREVEVENSSRPTCG